MYTRSVRKTKTKQKPILVFTGALRCRLPEKNGSATEKELFRHEWLKSLYSNDACVLNSFVLNNDI